MSHNSATRIVGINYFDAQKSLFKYFSPTRKIRAQQNFHRCKYYVDDFEPQS